MRCSAFLSRSVAVSFPTKVISIGTSNPTPVPPFIVVPVTLQLAYDPGKRRNLFNVLLRKRSTCPTTSSRWKWSIATKATVYSSYSLLSSLQQNKESLPIWGIHTDMYSLQPRENVLIECEENSSKVIGNSISIFSAKIFTNNNFSFASLIATLKLSIYPYRS